MQAQKGPQKMDEVKQPSRQDGLFGSQPFWNVFSKRAWEHDVDGVSTTMGSEAHSPKHHQWWIENLR